MTREEVDTFAAAVYAARHRLGLSQHAVAEMAGLSAAAVGRIEAGERSPTLHTIVVLSGALALNVVINRGVLEVTA